MIERDSTKVKMQREDMAVFINEGLSKWTSIALP